MTPKIGQSTRRKDNAVRQRATVKNKNCCSQSVKHFENSALPVYLGADVDGEVMDIVALISLIIGALLDRFRLTIGQSTSMAVTVLWTFMYASVFGRFRR